MRANAIPWLMLVRRYIWRSWWITYRRLCQGRYRWGHHLLQKQRWTIRYVLVIRVRKLSSRGVLPQFWKRLFLRFLLRDIGLILIGLNIESFGCFAIILAHFTHAKVIFVVCLFYLFNFLRLQFFLVLESGNHYFLVSFVLDFANSLIGLSFCLLGSILT